MGSQPGIPLRGSLASRQGAVQKDETSRRSSRYLHAVPAWRQGSAPAKCTSTQRGRSAIRPAFSNGAGHRTWQEILAVLPQPRGHAASPGRLDAAPGSKYARHCHGRRSAIGRMREHLWSTRRRRVQSPRRRRLASRDLARTRGHAALACAAASPTLCDWLHWGATVEQV